MSWGQQGEQVTDLRLDLAVVDNYSQTVSVLAGYGDGTFRSRVPVATGGSGFAVSIGSFDADATPDLAVVGSPSTLEILLSR